MIAALFALALLQGSPAPDPPRVLRAGPGEAYASPAEAVRAARPGDTVRVAAGVHRGALVVDRSVVLVAEPGAVLDAGGEGTAVTLAADSVVLRGFGIRESGRSLDADDAAVRVVECRGCRVVGNRVERSLHGIYLVRSHAVAVADNRIEGDAALDEPRRGNGIHLFDSHASRIEGNVIRGTRDGIYFGGSNGNLVARNDVREVRYGLHYMYSDDNEFRGNRFARNAAGAALMTSKRIVFRDNHFSEHVGYRAYGILLQSAEDVVAERNRLEGNLVGFFLDASVRSVFRGNAIVGNGVGIDLMASSEGNVFAGNAIAGNRVAVRKVMGSGENRWEEDGRGNYWGDAAVFDLDGDGVGERPYRVGDPFAALAAQRPALEVFAGTPAARALSWAEEAFPVFGVLRAVDPAPLARPPAGLLPPPAAARRDRAGEDGPRPGRGAGVPALALLPIALAALVRITRRRNNPRTER